MRCAYLSVCAGKIQENRRGFLGRFKGARGKFEIPRAPNCKPAQRLQFGKEEMSTEDKRRRLRRLVPPWSFLTRQRFLLEKQKKMLCRTCKFAVKYQPFNCSPKRRRGKKDTPVPRFGTRACLLRGATQIRGIFKIPPLLRRLRAARTGDFGAFAPYTHARRTSFPGSLQKPFSKAAFSLRRRGPGTASASLRVIGSIFCFSSSYANPDRRAAARGSAFPPRPDWSHRGRCTYRTGGACA